MINEYFKINDYSNLKFLYEKEHTLLNHFTGVSYKALVKFYECPICKKPFCHEEQIAFA